MDIPDSVRQKIELFSETGRVFRKNEELFAENSWVQVMMGQGLIPTGYHPIVDKMRDEERAKFFGQIQAGIQNTVGTLPHHEDFVRQYCGAPKQ